MTILATLVLLGVLIFVHELGHYWAAKAVGVGVERFSVGLGPKIWGFTRKGTEYWLAAVPLGGYVKMQGMGDEMMEHLEGGPSDTPWEPGEGDYDSKPIWARTIVISAGVIMNMLFAVVLYATTAAVWGGEIATTRVMTVEESLLPPGTEALAGIEPGATIVRVGGEEPESWEGVQRALFQSAPGPLAVATENPSGRFDIAVPVDPQERGRLAAAMAPWIDPVIASVAPGSPADEAALEGGDVVRAVAGTPVRSWADMVREIESRPEERVEMAIARGDAELLRVVVPERVGEGEAARGWLGVYRERFEKVRMPLGDAVAHGVAATVGTLRRILAFLRDLVSLKVSPREVGSIGTIAVVTGEAARAGPDRYLEFMALFSVNLAILNLLPIPILDGGHLMFLGLELVRRRKLSVEQRIRWSKVGLWVVLGIMVFALSNDVVRWVEGWFGN